MNKEHDFARIDFEDSILSEDEAVLRRLLIMAEEQCEAVDEFRIQIHEQIALISARRSLLAQLYESRMD